MPKPDNRKTVARRDFLKVAPLAGVAAVAGDATGADATPEDAPAEDHRQPRIADTDHVRTYYKLARS